jgi:glycosyltransferase 2 family protein
MNRRWLWIVAGLVIGAALLWYSARTISFAQVMEQLSNAKIGYLLPTIGLSGAFIAVKTQRWRVLLRPMASFSFADLHGPVYAGTAANLAVSHLGEFVRARMLGRISDLPVASILASIGLERVLDMVVMLMMVGCLFVAGDNYLSPSLASAGEVVAGFVFAGMLAIGAVVLWPVRCGLVIERLAAWLPRRHRQWIMRQFEHVAGGFTAVGDPWLVARALLLSIMQWSLIAAAIWCCMSAVGVTLNGIGAIALLVLLVLGLTLPTAPAYVGTTQAAFVAALALFDVDEQVAFAGSVIYTGCVVLPPFLVGVVCLVRHFRPVGRRRVTASAQ